MNLFRHRGLSQNDGDTGSPPRGPVLSAMGLPGHFPGRLNLQRKFVQDSENPKFGKKDWKIPRAGRIIRRSVYAFLRAATLGKDQPFMPMTRDASGVYKGLLLNMESQGNRRRYGVNHKALETILGHPQGLLPPEEPKE